MSEEQSTGDKFFRCHDSRMYYAIRANGVVEAFYDWQDGGQRDTWEASGMSPAEVSSELEAFYGGSVAISREDLPEGAR